MILAATTGIASATAWTDIGDWWGERFYYDSGGGTMFKERELSLDLFGTIYDGDRRDSAGRHVDGQLGGGIGLTYFVTQNWGMSLDTTIGDNGNAFFDYLAGSVIYRYPIDAIRLAPYAFAGFAGQFDLHEEFSGHIGIGAEYRINPLAGVFVDTRYVIADQINNYWLFRLGMRFVF